MNLGRFQHGQSVTLARATGARPDAAPTATVTGPSSAVVWSGKLAIGADDAHFARSVYLGAAFPALGTYQVAYSQQVGGVVTTATDTFELVGGGDIGGAVVALYCYDRPEGRCVVAQVAGGKLLVGRNPRL